MHPTTVRVLEIGGTHVTAASVDATTWQVRERSRTGLDSGASAERILATLSSAARTLADTVRVPWAVAIPDPFDYVRGIALFCEVGKFDALYGMDVRRALDEAIHPRPTRIVFVHDTEAFLRGEWTRGAAMGTERCAALTIGSGIGSAFLAQGGARCAMGLGCPRTGESTGSTSTAPRLSTPSPGGPFAPGTPRRPATALPTSARSPSEPAQATHRPMPCYGTPSTCSGARWLRRSRRSGRRCSSWVGRCRRPGT